MERMLNQPRSVSRLLWLWNHIAAIDRRMSAGRKNSLEIYPILVSNISDRLCSKLSASAYPSYVHLAEPSQNYLVAAVRKSQLASLRCLAAAFDTSTRGLSRSHAESVGNTPDGIDDGIRSRVQNGLAMFSATGLQHGAGSHRVLPK